MNFGVIAASVFWGGLGLGYWVYGKKQRSAPQLFGGGALMLISYFFSESGLWMSVAGIAILAGIHYWARNES